jgi:myosin heavy subunit
MFIWKNWNTDKDLEIKLEREKETVKQLINESTFEDKVNNSSSNLLNTSLIDNYHQILIKYISKESQTEDIKCKECVNNKENYDKLDEIKKINEYLEKTILELEEKIRSLIKDKDRQIELIIQLQIENDKLQMENNYKTEKIDLLDNNNNKLNLKINDLVEKMNKCNTMMDEELLKNKEFKFEIEKKINEIQSVKSENKRLESENYYLVNKMNDMQENIQNEYYQNDFQTDHSYQSKKKVQTHIEEMDIHTNTNENYFYNEYIDLQKKYTDIIEKMKEITIKNEELNKKVKNYEIRDMIQFNRAIRSKIPIAFHAVHTEINNLN